MTTITARGLPFRDIIAAELKKEGPNLARVLNRALEARGQGPRKHRGQFLPHIGGETLSDRVGQNCHLAYYNAVVLSTIRSQLSETVGRVVEMGSGWGAIISSLWLSGAPKDAEYWALEYTQSGREATELMASSEPRFHLKARSFDYHRPDFSQMTAPIETVVYSVYSIEQITIIKDDLIENILSIPGFTRCIHIEPVGWQVNPRSLSASIDRFAKKLGLPPLTQAAASARRCWRHGKNCNLIETLRRYERSGRIVIETIAKDLVANDPLNPGTLIVWRPA